MIDYKRAVSDMMADKNLALCFYTKQQCRELRDAIISEIGSDYLVGCGHAYPGEDIEDGAFRLERGVRAWRLNGGSHVTYKGRNREGWYRRFIEAYEIPDDDGEIYPVQSLSLLFGGAL